MYVSTQYNMLLSSILPHKLNTMYFYNYLMIIVRFITALYPMLNIVTVLITCRCRQGDPLRGDPVYVLNGVHDARCLTVNV